MALNIAYEEQTLYSAGGVVTSQQPVRLVRIYTDSQWALRVIQQPGEEDSFPALRDVWCSAERLSACGVRVELRWVKGHIGVLGNELADRVATSILRK
ncbi:hypothetical protein EJ05DRAFT_472132 [Pseudovirgaria hyperparasitica]|uniref:RNase H type-1 domain-containing protein n=1 Tax=Pseudovirgaria hyperparasitica TaxID=470096 RepID=A0A6A6WM40_9PEZI|nr:uncharacterized protein EJ05DRAFT_472132 [Pseudovirgaria hyperparasitica]KAF2763218.1 hypothetical protein EJ05DRAFT_472132 [Pseudovirgaria hyperparasitica]